LASVRDFFFDLIGIPNLSQFFSRQMYFRRWRVEEFIRTFENKHDFDWHHLRFDSMLHLKSFFDWISSKEKINFSVVGTKHICDALKFNSSLKNLSLSKNLCFFFKKKENLKILLIEENSIGDTGAKEISVALKANSCLETLNLGFFSLLKQYFFFIKEYLLHYSNMVLIINR